MGTHTFRANDDLSRAIDDRCLAESINKSELIIRAIEQYLAGEIQPVLQPVTQTDIDDRFQALEGEIQTIKKQLGAIVESGNTPHRTPHKTVNTIATGETIGDRILALLADGRNWSNDELLTHFPGVARGTLTTTLTRLGKSGTIEKVSPGVHCISKQEG